MKKTRFTEEQMVTILREADRAAGPGGGEEARRERADDLRLAETLRHAGAGRREAAAAARAREWAAEEDGGRPGPRDRRAQGDHAKKMVGARVRRQQVAYARSRGLSSRRACALLSVARSAVGYVSRLQARDAPVGAGDARARRASIRGTATGRSGSSLARQGHAMSAERTYRLWRQAGLQVPKRRPRRRVATESAPAGAADRDQSRVGVRLRLRHVRRRPVAEVPDHRR